MLLGRKVMTNWDSILKGRDIILWTKVHIVKAIVFPIVMYRCESQTIKKASTKELMFSNCGAGEDSWKSLGSKIKPVNPTGNQPWIFIGRTDAEAEAPILWPPDVKSQLIGKNPDAGKDWGQEKERGDRGWDMVGRHHRLKWHEFEWTLRNSGQRSLVCFSPWGCKESDTT